MIPNIFSFSPTNLDLKNINATLLERFINYPSSPSSTTVIKNDTTILRLIGELQVQGRTFRTLSKTSASQCYHDISQNLNRISQDFQIHKSTLEKEFYILNQEVGNLSNTASKQKFNTIKKGLMVGFGIGSLSNATLYFISPSLDGGLTLFATIITGGIMGWYCGKKMNERLKNEIKIKSSEIKNLKNSTNYIDLVVNDINKFDEKIIKHSKTFWTRQ
ncbi:1415_t:CDS:2 [Diversispora eburnea]|uniref:1415_t:CDS:1 n=1 Tax=Diversispora eburnea TaxID=1213867 RepID=A0A9N9BYP1_9GLOM|nr:1415_t:CDS:2 [Diversispora eburnea]